MRSIAKITGGRINGPTMRKVPRLIDPKSANQLGHLLAERLDLASLPPTQRRVKHVDGYSLTDLDGEAEMIDRLTGKDADPVFAGLLRYTIHKALREMPGSLRHDKVIHTPSRVVIGVNYYGPGEHLHPHTDATTKLHVVTAIGLLGSAHFLRTSVSSLDFEELTPEMVLRQWDIEPGDAMSILNNPDVRLGLPPHAVFNASSTEPRFGMRVEQEYTPQ